jgi:hypothetical protein
MMKGITDENLLDSAISLAENFGWRLIPLKGKKPIIRDWPRNASNDAAQLKKWWRAHPGANMGVATGAASGTDVLDVDGEKGKRSLLELQEKYGQLPETVLSETGGGGLHYFFSDSGEDFKNSTGKIAAGLDFKTNGGQVVLPPSTHPGTGKKYSWINSPGQTPLAPLPDWLRDLIRSNEKPQPKTPASQNQSDHRTHESSGSNYPNSVFFGADDGKRNDSCRDYIWVKQKQGLSEAEVTELVLKAAQDCRPPLEPKTVLEMVRRTFRKPIVRGRPEKISFADMLEREVPPVKWIIKDLLPQGLTLLSGLPKCGKSWLAMEFSLAIASGKDALGWYATEQGSVIHLAHEDSESLFVQRLKMLLQGNSCPTEAFFIPKFKERTGALDHITAYAAETLNLRLIVIDTLQRVRGAQGKSQTLYTFDYDAVAPYVDLAANMGVSILIIHHDRKQDDDQHLNRVSGSTALTGAADNIMSLTSDLKAGTGQLEITGRYGEPQQVAMRFDSYTGQWIWTDPSEKAKKEISQQRRDVVLKLKEYGPLSPSDIADLLDKKAGTIRKLLLEMKKRGEVERGDDGKYSQPKTECLDKDQKRAQLGSIGKTGVTQ